MSQGFCLLKLRQNAPSVIGDKKRFFSGEGPAPFTTLYPSTPTAPRHLLAEILNTPLRSACHTKPISHCNDFVALSYRYARARHRHRWRHWRVCLSVRPSICPSYAGIDLKLITVGSRSFHRRVVQDSSTNFHTVGTRVSTFVRPYKKLGCRRDASCQ